MAGRWECWSARSGRSTTPSPAASASPLPPLPVQYADFALWQRGWLQGEALAAQVSYWKEQLRGAPPYLPLPTDHPRPPVQSYRGGHRRLELGPEVVRALRELSQAEGATLFMTLLAGFAALLHRYTQQTDIVIGSPVANRNRGEIEGLIGFFVNTLALRADVSGDPPFRVLLGRVREAALGAYAHQDLPFEKLVEELQPRRDRSRSPLFQVLLALQNAPMPPLRLGDLALEPLELPGVSSKFDLSIYWTEAGGRLQGYLEHNLDLFDPPTVERFAAHYVRLLEGAAADPERRVCDLPLLGADERHRLLVEWNQTASEYPREACVHELVAAQAGRTPEAPAVVFEEAALRFAELEARSSQLARHLEALGAGPGMLMGVCVERSIEMVVAVLGILKSGAAYVPLDPSYPAERLAFVVEDSQAEVVLTQSGLAQALPVRAGTRLVCLDAEADAIAARETGPLPARATASDLAYVIYTSGSTGRPKGVAVPHRALVNFLTSVRTAPGLTAEDTLLALTALSFDIAGLEIFLPLIVGARLAVAGAALASDGTRLARRLREGDVTVMQATPSTWRMLVGAGWEGSPRLRALCGGEALPRELANRLAQSHESLWNLYGPTETTIWSALGRVEAGEGPVTIGRPLANTRLYVLDPRGEPAPIGVPGELSIGGDGLARGYHRRADLTAERFVPDPFGASAADRLYRTGDLARVLPSGEIEVLGRLDDQVKVRGFRIELGEVEGALVQHPSVREAVVAVHEDAQGGARLVAYFVPDADLVPTPGELRAFLGRTLPASMLPSTFVALEALPLTPNRKVDRRALPAPSQSRPDLGHAFEPPRTPTEQALAEIYSQVLGIDRVGIHDSFFDLGGASIQSVEVSARAGEAGLSLAPEQIFEYPTVAELAAALAAPASDPARRG
jgi:amino acid adenylation domain-containing protein